jgi:hypothetical protein
MPPIPLTDLRQRRVRLTREPLAARRARGQVRAAVRAWDVPVDPDLAVLLTSDLVTEAITHGDGQRMSLSIRCVRAALRVEVYHARQPEPGEAARAAAGEPAGAGHGLVLVAALATDWGAFRTPGGRAMYFTLGFEPGFPPARGRGDGRGDGELYTPPGLPSPRPDDAEQHQLRGTVATTLGRPPQRPGPPDGWSRSSHSYANGNCVEVRSLPGGRIAVRDSTQPGGAVLRFSADGWGSFLDVIRSRDRAQPAR